MKVSARKYAIFAPLLLAAGAGLVALVACENQSGTYVYRGRKYDPGTKCLEAPRALDVIEVDLPEERPLELRDSPAFLGVAHIAGGELIPDRLLSPPEVQAQLTLTLASVPELASAA